MSKQNNLKDYLTDLYEGISTKRPNASRNPQNFRSEIESIEGEKAKLQEKTLTANGVYPPDSGYDGFSKVTVDVAGKVLPKYDGEVIIEGEPESGGEGGSSAEFNIAYGDTAPSDTSKLWVKANEPEAVSVTSAVVTAGEELESGISALPTGAYGIASAVVGTKVYLFGGLSGSSSYLDTINVFDTESKTTTTLDTTLPTGAYGIAAAAVGTKIYLFGGYGGKYLNTINIFDTESNTITTLSTTLSTSYTRDIAAVAFGTQIYLFGGQSGDYSYHTSIRVFDTVSNTTGDTGKSTINLAGNTTAALVGSKVYLFGGYTYVGGKGAYVNTINVFDIENNTVEKLSTTLPNELQGIAAAAFGTKIYLFGGDGAYSTCYSSIYVFDTESNTVETFNTMLPMKASKIASAVVGTQAYLFGGYDVSSTLTKFYHSTINLFTGSMPLATNNLLIEASATKNRFNLLPNVELGVNNVYLGNADGNGERVDAYLHNGTEWVEV